MNAIVLQGRIVNLNNVTTIERYRPGDRYPSHPFSSFHFSKHTIWIEFNTIEGDAKDFSPAGRMFEYKNEADSNRDWRRLCELAGLQ